ncbi:MAG: hypothetical protein ACI85H_000505 [Paracoccaceae bacterium]
MAKRVEDLGNYKLVTALIQELSIKVIVPQDTAILTEKAFLNMPAQHFGIYKNKNLL